MNATISKWSWYLAPAALAYGAAVLAQDRPAGYPSRPIRIIISVAPGAGADMVARMTAQILIDKWGQNAVVDPRPGGGGVVASTYAAKAEPDGYTLYQNGFGLLFQGAAQRVPFDVLKVFEPVVRTTSQPYILMATSNITVNTVKELIALSAVKPLTYMERLAVLSGMKLRHIAYKGSAPAILALMGGEINLAAGSAMSAIAAIKTGKVRALATLGLKRVPVLPDLPSVAEQGYPGFAIDNNYNLWVPAGTPPAIIAALNRVISDGMNAPEVEKRLLASGSEAVDPMPPQALKKILARDYADIVQTVKKLGLKF
jgi:tripartite-type tricarboxylate transporter receptor subunit TctC